MTLDRRAGQPRKRRPKKQAGKATEFGAKRPHQQRFTEAV